MTLTITQLQYSPTIVVDANYKFIHVDVGCNGRVSDGGVFRNCNLFTAIENNTLNMPTPEPSGR